MALFSLLSKNRWISLGAASALAIALAGCGGGGGGTAATDSGGGGGGGGGSGGGTSALVTPPSGTPVNAAALSVTDIAALQLQGAVTGVTINSPPVVTFQITNQNNNGITGFGWTTKSSTAVRPGLANMAFMLSKLVPGTNGSPSKWVSYVVTSSPTTTAPEGAARPTSENIGTLVDNGDGTYKYTFYRDITKAKDIVGTTTGDLGDVTYDATLIHRLVIQVGGNVRGTGTNTADGSSSGVTAVPMSNPVNIVFDWIPATGQVLKPTDANQRELVAVANCNECHGKLGFHGGGARVDTRTCVMCHSDQRKFGQMAVTSTAGKFPALKETATVNSTTGITSYSYSPSTYVADGEVTGNFPIMIHKIHQGKELVKENYNYANVVFDLKGYSMLDGGQRMCTKCHDNAKAAQADNWKNKPSRQACGACHDGIKWSDGTGMTLADKAAGTGAQTGHIGKGQSDDATCALCHAPAAIATYHLTNNATKHNPTVPAGLKNISYEIKSADVDKTTNNVTIVFRVLADGSAVTFLAPAAGMANPLSGFTGAASFLLAYATDATATDGVKVPADYNNAGNKQAQAISVSIAALLDTTKTADGSIVAGTGTNTGYYVATLLGAGTKKFPVGAVMRAVALQGYFTQAAGTGGIATATPRHAVAVLKEVTGDTVRRKVVDSEKCANCHEWFEGHGGNRVYQAQVCVMCHVPGLATSGRQIPDATMNTWTFTAALQKIVDFWKFDKTAVNAALKLPVTTNNFKDMIHGIHVGRERVDPFRDARDSTSRGAITLLDFARMDFPGKLNNCETCHIAGTYSGVPLNTLPSTYETIDAAYDAAITAGTATTALAKAALATTTANATDHVTTPFAAACVSCHDAPSAQAHMKTQGGLINVNRATVLGTAEACATCHGAGKADDPAVVHKK